MRAIDSKHAREILDRHAVAGFHVDNRLIHQIEQPGKMFVLSVNVEDHFLRLVWQSIDEARPLVPVGFPRTLRDCATRLDLFDWQFRTLVESGYPWFERCVTIDESFDYSKLGWIAVTPLDDREKRDNPDGTYYIYDGVHKSLVLAKKLLRSELEFEPVELLLLIPRRG
jgi:hypothetical protein